MKPSRLDIALHSLDAGQKQNTGADTVAGAWTRLDARAYLCITLVFIVIVLSFERHSISALLPFALYPIVMAALGGVSLASLGRALALAAPFVVCVGIWNPVFDTRPMLTLGALTLSAGWVSFFSLILRCALCVSAVTVMVRLCGFTQLCAALARLGVPRVFAAQLLILHRALFILLNEAARMRRARDVRAFGRRGQGLRATAPLIGNLLLRSLDRAERIHTAMLCRGFDGAMPASERTPFDRYALLFCAVWCAFFALARAVDLPRALEAGLATLIGAFL